MLLGFRRLSMGGVLIAITLAIVLVYKYYLGRIPVRDSSQSQLSRLHQACIQDMLTSTCSVMSGGNVSATAANPSKLVFIAGIGAIDAVEYQKMYQAGDHMCAVISDSCRSDWNSKQCITARKIFLSP